MSIRGRTIVDALVTALMAAAAITMIVFVVRAESRQHQAAWVRIPLPTTPVQLDRAILRGSASAGVVLLVYSDFQCPFCRRFALDTLPEVERTYVERGRVLLAFQSFPLISVHPFAQRTAEAAKCADRQQDFWQMHDLLFADPEHVDDASLSARAKNIGMNVDAFASCMAASTGSAVREDILAGLQVGLKGTPTIFIGTLSTSHVISVTDALTGAVPPADLSRILEQRLREGSGR